MMMSAVQHHVASIIESAVWFKPLPNPPFTLYLLSWFYLTGLIGTAQVSKEARCTCDNKISSPAAMLDKNTEDWSEKAE
jgi:hypothetical protein